MNQAGRRRRLTLEDDSEKIVDIKRYSKSFAVQNMLRRALQNCDLLKNVPESVVDKMVETMEMLEFDMDQVGLDLG